MPKSKQKSKKAPPRYFKGTGSLPKRGEPFKCCEGTVGALLAYQPKKRKRSRKRSRKMSSSSSRGGGGSSNNANRPSGNTLAHLSLFGPSRAEVEHLRSRAGGVRPIEDVLYLDPQGGSWKAKKGKKNKS